MSKPKSRRRLVLSTLLASGMSVAAAVGGYVLYGSSSSDLSPAAQDDLDAGFESAQSNDTLGAMASAWKRETLIVDKPVAVVPAPEIQVDDRYEQRLATSGDDSASTSRYAVPATSEEPRDAGETLARGQSPVAELPPIESVPSNNPLRDAADPFEAAAMLPARPIDHQAEDAFAEPAPLPYGNNSVGPDPTADTGANPLRAATPPAAQQAFERQPPVAAPAAAPFADARPMADSRYADFEPEPTPAYTDQFDTPEPTEVASLPPASHDALSAHEPAAKQFAPSAPMEMADRGYSSEPAPMQATEDYNAFAPQPSAMTASRAIDEGTGRPGERALEGAQRPSLVLQKFAPEEVQVGKECKFVLKVRNVGQRPADNVLVDDEVPLGSRFVGASPQAEVNDSHLQWQLGTLSPGEERTIEVELMPTDEGELGSVAQVTFASYASAKSRCTRPQLALRMTAPSEVLIGRQQRITIELHNPGTGDATGVMLLENVPEHVRHQAGPALEFEVGTLRAGETRRMDLVVTAEKPGHVINVLTARADGNLQVQQEVEFEIISPALAVDVQGPSRRYLERPATYTVKVDNPGTAPAKDVQLVTKLPKGMRFVRANNLGEYDSATHSIYWSLAELPEGQQGTVELVALPVQSGDHTIEVEGRAREGLEDRTSQPVRIEGLAAIMFEVVDSQDPIEVGGTTSYEIRVVNQGSKAATNVQVTALVPPGMAVTNAQGQTRHSVEAEGVVFAPLDRLAPKADAVFRVDVQGVRPGDQRMTVEVRTDDIAQPIRKEESTRVFGDE